MAGRASVRRDEEKAAERRGRRTAGARTEARGGSGTPRCAGRRRAGEGRRRRCTDMGASDEFSIRVREDRRILIYIFERLAEPTRALNRGRPAASWPGIPHMTAWKGRE